MGDTYFLKLRCAYCGKENPKPNDDMELLEFGDYISYNPDCKIDTFTCDYCKKENRIIQDFKAIQLK